MQRVECPDCSHRFNADLPAAGQTCQCPRCGATLSLDAAEDGGPSPEPEEEAMPTAAVGSPAPPVVVPPYAAPPQEPESPFDWTPFLRLIAVLFLLAACSTIVSGVVKEGPSRYYAESSGLRFKADNAVGATANAVEHIAGHLPALGGSEHTSSAPWFACFLITCLILSVQQLTRAVESSNRRAVR